MILNRKRIRQWLRVLRLEGRSVGWLAVARDISVALWLGLFDRQRTRRRWFKRMRACNRCFVYDKELKRCRPSNVSPLGCGCYTPFKAAVDPGPCWIRKNLLTPDGEPAFDFKGWE